MIYRPIPDHDYIDHSSGIPTLIPRPLKPDVLCIGIKKGNQTVIFYNENRDIPDDLRRTALAQ